MGKYSSIVSLQKLCTIFFYIAPNHKLVQLWTQNPYLCFYVFYCGCLLNEAKNFFTKLSMN